MTNQGVYIKKDNRVPGCRTSFLSGRKDGTLIVAMKWFKTENLNRMFMYFICTSMYVRKSVFIFGSFLKDCCFQPKIVVDWSARCETPAGAVGQVRPHRCVAPRRLTAHPAESEHPEAEINNCCTLLYFKQQSLRTEPYF